MYYYSIKGYIFKSPVKEENIKKGKDLYLPVEIDTEFQGRRFPHQLIIQRIKKTITLQIRSIDNPIGKIYTHHSVKNASERIPQLKKDESALIRYLNEEGSNAVFKRNYVDEKNPKIIVCPIGFFLVVDIYKFFEGDIADDIIRIARDSENTGKIDCKKYLHTKTIYPGSQTSANYITLKHSIEINGKMYTLCIQPIDTSALLGNSTYQRSCEMLGIPLPYKEDINAEDKRRMLDVYYEDPEKFKNYALGDLYNYQLLQKYIGLTKHLCNRFKIDHIRTKLTVGSTANQILENLVIKHFGIEQTDHFHDLVIPGASTTFLLNQDETSVYLAKTNGGRCEKLNPKEYQAKGHLIDIDVQGCYAWGTVIQQYPIGNPIITSYSLSSKRNKYQTLRQFIEDYKDEFVPGLWMARVSTKENYKLKHSQDLLMSWMPPKQKVGKEALEEKDDNIINNGFSKVYTREVHLAVFGTNELDWIMECVPKSQRDELLDNLEIITAIIYPKSERVDTVKEVIDKREKHRGRNVCVHKKVEGFLTTYNIRRDSNAWTSATMGDIGIEKLQKLRNTFKRKDPMNEYIKLIINSMYGVLVSHYFYGNVVCGNNITSRARLYIWMMEKALGGKQTITDGVLFDAEKVTKRKCYHSKTSYLENKSLRKGPLKPIKELDEMTDEEIVIEAKKHMLKTFPNMKDLINYFGVEVKDQCTKAGLHGAANYILANADKVIKVKMRGYKKHEYLLEDEKIKPVEDFLSSLMNTENGWIDRTKVYVESKILRHAEYKKRKMHWDQLNLKPGDTYEIPRRLNEFTLSGFKFQTHDQFLKWKSFIARLKNRSNGEGIEQFFTEGNRLNYKQMMEEVSKQIDNGNTYFKKNGVKSTLVGFEDIINKYQKMIDEIYKNEI